MTSKWISFLEKNAHEFKNKIAVIDQQTKRNLTYNELNQEVNALAGVLLEQGLVAQDAVAFYAKANCLFHLTLMLACAKLKIIFVPLNFRLSSNEAEAVLNNLSPRLFLGISDQPLSFSGKYLDISKIEANREELFLEMIAVEDICLSALSMLQARAKEQNIELKLEIDPKEDRVPRTCELCPGDQ